MVKALAFVTFFEIPVAWAGSAIVIHGGGCVLVDTNANFFFDPNGAQTAVLSDSGNSKITCTSQLPSSSTRPSTAVSWDFASLNAALGSPVLCGTDFGLTTDYLEIVTPSGQVILTCRVNPNPAPWGKRRVMRQVTITGRDKCRNWQIASRDS